MHVSRAAILFLFLPFLGPPVTSQAQSTGTAFPKERLEQLVAPIALYSDPLLAQVLMAATYPLEIVEAARWLEKHPGLTGQALENALTQETWDPSVKSLCGLPDVLNRMNENLDWTRDLGDAFLGQKALLMDAVQMMRQQAKAAGNLESNDQQKVVTEDDDLIAIEPANPEVVYVPTYYPVVVYGSWAYPSWYYPALYVPPPRGAALIGFSAGVLWGKAMWGGCHWGWGHTDIDINVNRYNTFVDHTEVATRRAEVRREVGTNGEWRHDPEHRQGVGYRNPEVAERYGAAAGQNRVSREQARGYSDRATAARGGMPRTTGSGVAPRTTGAGTAQRPAAPRDRPVPSSAGTGTFSGVRNPGFDRAASTRGRYSSGAGGARISGRR